MSPSANSKAVTTAVVGCQADATFFDEKKFTAIIYIYIYRLPIIKMIHLEKIQK